MKLDNRIILTIIVILTLCLSPIAIYTSGPVRIILSFLSMLLFPGYTLISALFPKKDATGVIERIALSFGTSIAIVTIMGFMLNFTPWGIKLISILISVGTFILIMSVIGFVRLQLLPVEKRFVIPLRYGGTGWNEMARAKKRLLVVIIIVVVAALSLVFYFETALPQEQRPSEFYILSAEGSAAGYPRLTKAGEQFNVRVVLVNHESKSTDFTVKVISADTVISKVDTNYLSTEQKWEGNIGLTLKNSGNDQKVEFYLYKGGENAPYFKQPLYLYIDVTE